MPIRFWSNERWGIPTPCANKGFAHAHQVKLGRWAMRRVKGVFGDFCIAGRRTTCTACKREKAAMADERDELKADLEQLIGEQAAAEACNDGSMMISKTITYIYIDRYR